MIQCYYNDHTPNERCKNNAAEEDGPLDCWCSPEHKKLWQAKNHFEPDREHRRKLTVKEMQQRLLEIGARVGPAQKKINL